MRLPQGYVRRMRSPYRPTILRAALASAVLATAFAFAGTCLASTSNMLRIGGRVPAQATLWFSSLRSLLFSLDGNLLGKRKVQLAEFGVFANNRQFTVSVVSRNAGSTGTPHLIDPATGASLAYALTYDGENMVFDGGEALIASGAGGDGPQGAAKVLELAVAKPFEIGSSRLQEHLVIVVSAR
jgi:hypothetical protein